ncbi:uncharacterized protein CDAR_243051 [Caerostris darwini]|uniref:Uncharacterized protein n=1 Tax=Caerostris darwini TaxID=1538125 RepID=A0AAV4SW82_9ARAC|nr:uncharacterized protein CDAR_243051 [Caerostris darwini]
MHYNGSLTTPDLLLVSSGTVSDITRTVLEDPSSGHRMVIAAIAIDPKHIHDHSYSKISWNFKKSVKSWIPRGRVKHCRCFWNDDIERERNLRDRLRKKAESSRCSTAVKSWRRQSAIVKKAILDSKRKSITNYIGSIHYKKRQPQNL